MITINAFRSPSGICSARAAGAGAAQIRGMRFDCRRDSGFRSGACPPRGLRVRAAREGTTHPAGGGLIVRPCAM